MTINTPSKIDISFDFHSETPLGKDPDSFSPTLRLYHKILWSKPLPNGQMFELTNTRPKAYLHHESDLGEFYLSSDAITHSYQNTKKIAHIIKEIPSEHVKALYKYGSTIGAYIVFPSNRINQQMTINGARGCNAAIADRFDLTLECIRLFYNNVESPLSSVFERYIDFFNLFNSFQGYVDFFLLQDLVTPDYSDIKFHLQHSSFDDSPLPNNKNEYLEYKENTIKFIQARGHRMIL